MTEYFGIKRIEAWPETGKDGRDGYAVKYLDTPDQYVSWSPKDVFEEAYHETGSLKGQELKQCFESLKGY